MAVKQKVVEMVGPGGTSPQPNLDDLTKYIQLLKSTQNQSETLLDKTELVNVCKHVVVSLGKFQMPTEADQISSFIKGVEEIKAFLKMACDYYRQEVLFAMFTALYSCISNTQVEAGPGLAVVLEFFDPKYITGSIRWIIGPHCSCTSLVRGLNVLISWLFKWTRNQQLSRWIVAYMEGLRTLERYNVLQQVTLEKISTMCSMLKLPAYRTNVSHVLFHMLCANQHSPEAFLTAIEQFPETVQRLRQEDSDSSEFCLQSIVDVSTALMEHFPEHEEKYERLKDAIKDIPPSLNYQNRLDVEQWASKNHLNESGFHSGKVGLINLGNTCYMNSVLQALFMTYSFRKEILLSPSTSNTTVLSGLQKLFVLLQFSERSAVQANDTLIGIRPPGFVPGLQHDSSEYMGYLLDTLHEQEKNLFGSPYKNSDEGASKIVSNETTIVQRNYCGKTITTFRCETCNGESVQSDPFRDIQLSFPTGTRDNSIQTLLEFFLEPEQLCGENQYRCNRCAELRDAERIVRIDELPPHLILTLKHFRYDPKTQQRTKLLQRVCYDQIITLNSFRYELYAAVVHSGSSVDSGHYYTYATDNLNVWYKFNDSWVTRSTVDELTSLQQPATPYVLFYQRQGVEPASIVPIDSLTKSLQALIDEDRANNLAEQLQENERRREPSPILRKYNNDSDDDMDDNPPTLSCGDGDFNVNNSGRFVC